MKKTTLALLLFLVQCLHLTAQDNSDLRLGGWAIHTSLQSAFAVAVTTNIVYYATENALIAYHKADGETDVYTKVNGLSSTHLRKLIYNEATKSLLIIYDDSNMDVLRADGSIVNISDIKRATVAGNKTVNNGFSYDTAVFLACDFGLMQVNMERMEVASSTFTPNMQTEDFTVLHDTLFLATTKGIYYTTPDKNILDFAQAWQLIPYVGLPAKVASAQITNFKNTLVADVNDTIYIRSGAGWKKLFYQPNTTAVTSLHANDKYFVACFDRNSGGNILTQVYESGYTFSPSIPNLIYNIGQAMPDKDDNIWIADKNVGTSRYNSALYQGENIRLNSIVDKKTRKVAIHKDTKDVWVAAGSVSDYMTYGNNKSGAYRYKDGRWAQYQKDIIANMPQMANIINVAIRPSDGHVFVGSCASETRAPLIEFDADGVVVKVHTITNSSLQAAIGDTESCRVSSLFFDKNDNLWVTNYLAPRPLSVLKPDGTWKSFSLPRNEVFDLTIDDNNTKFIASTGGIVAFNEGKMDDNTDDKTTLLDNSNSQLPANKVNTIAINLDGDVWAGTDVGVAVFQCAGSVFSTQSPCKGTKPIIVVDGFGEFLLKNEIIKSISIDGANRIWFGTTRGIYVQSPDGRSTIQKFTAETSPLLSNEIEGVTFNPETGEAWITTPEGINVYRTNATNAPETISPSNVFAFPNPVRPDYTGDIAVSGLSRDATVKITDVAGNLLYETTALGGQAVWNGNDYNGRRAASGVYLVYSSQKDGTKAVVAKILIVK